MSINIVSDWKSFGGRQQVVEHESKACGGTMKFGIFLPPGDGPHPVLYFLSGLTCSWQNVTEKGGFQRLAAELGVAVVAPDTSPRGEDVHDTPDRWDLGKGAGFYVNATAEPWSKHYQMYDYIVEELPQVLADNFPVDLSRQSITGHSMGGLGALVIGLRNPEQYRAISAFSPIVAPSEVQWGQDALGAYLQSEDEWAAYDPTKLVAKYAQKDREILIDQGKADNFLEPQLRPQRFADACKAAGQPLNLRLHEGYDHSYYFISTFLGEHLEFHARALRG
ncbi:S-formylglutathione hydrolase [Bradymonas sediminis]|uniref:S-formylglutathione hydrolase n=1 Tax=Bradymonas sediminis TaxID=1548548 RepID=A0A2Z4FR15_9DELT|nr:S-formylglutathione hydrolase [Bradymonas sediminis]AWV91066.1 S-formylglutathione hydrolase [Bradymonas sediminis]TDP75192.1 S-formylglutathione hydrolase [Bradymonas sediminis]